MKVTIDELLMGKNTLIKKNEYLSAKEYVEPFIDRMSKYTNTFKVQATLPQQMSMTNKNIGNVERLSEDTVFNRVWIQAILPGEYCFTNHSCVVGLIYGLDVRKPLAKIYVGGLNNACLNLCIFNPAFLNVQILQPKQAIDFTCITNLMERKTDLNVWLERLKETVVPYDKRIIDENVGNWVRNSISACYDQGYGKVKLSAGNVVDAYKLIYENRESPYFTDEGEQTDMFNVYNAFTQVIGDDVKDIVNKVEKVLLLKQILSIAAY